MNEKEIILSMLKLSIDYNSAVMGLVAQVMNEKNVNGKAVHRELKKMHNIYKESSEKVIKLALDKDKK